MRRKKDPRLADLSPNQPTVAADVIESKKEEKKKAKREMVRNRGPRRIRWANRPEWLTTLMATVGVLLIAYLIFSGAKVINETLVQNQKQKVLTDVWRQLLTANVTVKGTPTEVDELGNASFPAISFEAMRNKTELHRNLRLSAALPGIRTVSLAPEDPRFIGRGVADDKTLEIVAEIYPTLDLLDLSGTKITSLQAIDGINLRALKLINTPIKREKLTTLQMFDGVTDLWIGWYEDSSNVENAVYSSAGYRQRLIDVLGKMKNLRNLHLYNMTLTGEELEELPGVNPIIVN